MLPKLYARVELLANIAILIAAVLLGYFLIQTLFLTKEVPAPPKQIEKGSKIELANVNWSANGKTLVLVLQKDCKFCSQSIPFYKTLLPMAHDKGVSVIAILPGSIEESRQYFVENGLPIEDIRQMELRDVSVRGTPTVILFNNKGEVSNSWVGKLPADKEQELIYQL